MPQFAHTIHTDSPTTVAVKRPAGKVGGIVLGAGLLAATLSACGYGEPAENVQLEAVASEMNRTLAVADEDVSDFLADQIDLLRAEYQRQCGLTDTGETPEDCAFDLDDELPPAAEADDRADLLNGVQTALLDAIEMPELPNAHDEEHGPDGDNMTREEYQTQLLTGIYAATSPVAGAPSAQTLLTEEQSLPENPKLNGAELESFDAALDNVNAAIQASGLALAVDDGTHAKAFNAVANDLRAIRDLLTNFREHSENDPYVPPAGFALADGITQPKKPAEAADFMLSVTEVPLSQLRHLAGTSAHGENRKFYATVTGLAARTQGKIELSVGKNPAETIVRGGVTEKS